MSAPGIARPVRLLALLAGASILALLLAELLVRLLAPQHLERGGIGYMDEVVDDLKASFTGTFSYPDYEYTVRTDSLRLRKTWAPSPDTAGVTVLVLGDSFAHGIGVQDDETIPSMIARGLAARGLRARVLNGGVPGYSSSEALCKFRRLRREVSPDAVVLLLSFNDALTSPASCDQAAVPPSSSGAEAPVPLGARVHAAARDFVLGHSHLGVLLAYRINALLIRSGLRARFVGTAAAYDPQVYRDYRDLVVNTASVLGRLREESRADAADAVLVYVPGFLEADDDIWESAQRLEGRRLARGLARESVLAAARSAGFEHIVAPPADASGRTAMRKLYFPLDMHLNLAGNVYVAGLVVDALAASLEARTRSPRGDGRPAARRP